MIGNSCKFSAAVELLRRFAACDAPVLIEGETGTGKELAAREIHYCSRRQNHPFVPVNCGALPDGLVEDELFGHVSGAYTDARSARRGLVEVAAGGTLFFDEVDALPLKAQVTLLRFLQDQEFRAVGSTKFCTADVRVVAACNSKLQDLVEKSLFRRDLYFRLNTLFVRMPLLREREGDIDILAAHFLECAAKQLNRATPRLSASALAEINHYQFPGNVRELESIVFRAVLLTEGPEIAAAALGLHSAARSSLLSSPQFNSVFGEEFDRFVNAKAVAVTAFETVYLNELIRRSKGNVTLAAKISGTERRQLGKLLKKHGIDPKAGPALQ